MFRAMFSLIIRSTWLYLQYLVVFTQVAAGWCLGCFETELCVLWGVYKRVYTVFWTAYNSIFDLELRKKLVKCYVWSIALYDAETWTLRTVDQKNLESFEMWCWWRMEKISWTDHVRNEEVLLRVKEQRNTLHTQTESELDWSHFA
jgi:hypothetical protein